VNNSKSSVEKSSVKDTAKDEKAAQTDNDNADLQQAVVQETAQEIPKEAAEEAASLLAAQITQTVAETLQVDVSQVTDALKELNMNVTDLFEPQNLTALIVEIKDFNGPQDILTDTDTAAAFKMLTTQLSDLAAEVQPEVVKQQTVTEPVVQTAKPEEKVTVEQENDSTPVQTTVSENTQETDESQSHTQDESEQHTRQDENFQTVTNANPQNVQDMLMQNIEEALNEKVDAQVSRSIVNQVIEQVQVQMKSDVTSLEMQLYPEHLGKVSIQVAAKNGVLTAQIAAETEAAKVALESQIQTLKDSLDNQGLKVESVEVMVSSRGFEQNPDAKEQQADQRGQGRKQRKTAVDALLENRDTEEEENLKETLGNTVSYTA
jgi:flagellar hook-length control protein FliK